MKKISNNQAGVTLLISILIMSGLALISVAVGAFTIQEIRQSRATALTEPAIAAAESGGEQTIWKIKRQVSLNEINSCPDLTGSNLGNNTRTEVCRSYGPAILQLEAGITYELFLYDPDDINGNLCMDDSSGNPLYTSVTIERLSGNQLIDVVIEDLSGVPIPGGTGSFSSASIPIPDPDPCSSDERLKIIVSSVEVATVEINGLPLGVPDRPIIRSHGCSSRGSVATSCTGSEVFNRRIDITVQ